MSLMGGGPEGAVAGAQGGGGGDFGSILQSLSASIEALKMAVERLTSGAGAQGGGGATGGGGGGCGGGRGAVAGVRGRAAAKDDVVAEVNIPSRSSEEDHEYEQRVLDLVNQFRKQNGLGALSYNALLDSAAEKHAVQMARTGVMAHDGIGNGDPGSRIRAEGFGKAWGENVATGQMSPEQVVAEWIASPKHLRNLLDPNFRQMGVSYVQNANGRSYWAQEFGAA